VIVRGDLLRLEQIVAKPPLQCVKYTNAADGIEVSLEPGVGQGCCG